MSIIPSKVGKMIVFTAPSGAGKTTIVRHIIEKYNFLGFSVSATTRQPRPNEEDGKDYYFLSIDEFKSRILNNDFVEWQEVYINQFYGTLYSEIQRIWNADKHIVFDIDVMGAQNIKKAYGDQCLTIFVRPPSIDILVKRLTARNTETAESLEKRVDKIKREMTFENSFDFVLVNDILELAILEANHLVDTFISEENKDVKKSADIQSNNSSD